MRGGTSLAAQWIRIQPASAGCGYGPWSGKVPPARPGQLSTTAEVSAATAEACAPGACALHREKPIHEEPAHRKDQASPLTARENPHAATKTHYSQI